MFPNLEMVKTGCKVGETGSDPDRSRPNLCYRSSVEAMEDIKRPLAAGFVILRWTQKSALIAGELWKETWKKIDLNVFVETMNKSTMEERTTKKG